MLFARIGACSGAFRGRNVCMEADKTALARTWADAVPLGKFAAARAEGLAKSSSGSDGKRPEEPFAALAVTVHYHVNLRSAFDRAYEATINDLIAGRIVCLGRKSKSYAFQAVEPAFWSGATIDWGGNAASRGRLSMIDLRVAANPSAASTPPEPKQGDVQETHTAVTFCETRWLAGLRIRLHSAR